MAQENDLAVNEAAVERLYVVLRQCAKNNADSLFDLEVATPFLLRALAREAIRWCILSRDNLSQ